MALLDIPANGRTAEGGEVGMIVTNDGYSILHEKRANRIIISLPQTMETVSNSEFTGSELFAILSVTKAIAEGR